MYNKVIKKVINIVLIVLVIFLALCAFLSIKSFWPDSFFKANSNKEDINSTPEFYGTIGINLKVGDKLDLTSSVFRIFAKDFYDGDLTQNINIISNTVNMESEGEYEIKYSVKNSLEKSAEIIVPVIVSNNQERTVKRKIYGAEDAWNLNLMGSYRGNKQDRQNLGIYAKAGASIKIRAINDYDNSSIIGDFLNNNRDKEKSFNVTNEWTTITTEVDSVPFIKTSSIDSRTIYQHISNIGYSLIGPSYFKQANNNSIYFANVFEKKNTNEAISEIRIPVYDCEEAEVYINTAGNEINSDGYKLVKTLNKPNNGYAIINLLEPIKIEGNKFIIAVKYTGTYVPVNRESTKYTYISNNLNSNWEMVEGIYNIPPIICKSSNKYENNLPIIEINIDDIFKENSLIKSLDYYMYGDDEGKFFEKWEKSQNSYAVMENDRITFLTPLTDKSKILSNSEVGYSYNSIKDIFNIYNDIFKMYDGFLGLEDKAEYSINQNVKMKYFVKADEGYSNKGAAAYYAINDYTAKVGNSIVAFLYKNWTPLHELGHGYEGDLDGGQLYGNNINLSEAANNIFAYYYERTYITSQAKGWLGNINLNDYKWNSKREEFTEDFKFNEIVNQRYSDTDHYQIRLYMMVNLLDKLGPQEVMSAYYTNLRENRLVGGNLSNVDLLVKVIFEKWGYNIIPYFESWHIDVSEDIKTEIEKKNAPMLYYLVDLVDSYNKRTQIKNEFNLDSEYSLVFNDEISKYNLIGNAKIRLTEAEYNKFKGKNIKLKSGTDVIKEEKIEAIEVEFKDVPIGIYNIEISNTTDNIEKKYLVVKEVVDKIPPTLLKLEVIGPETGSYNAVQELIIQATFGEEIKIKDNCPLPSLSFGDNQAKGSISVLNMGTDTITWKYITTCEDIGELRVNSIDFSNISDVRENFMKVIENPSLTGYKITATGHEWGEWIVTKEATEDKEGEEKRICKNNSNHIEKRVIPQKNHSHTFLKKEEVPATCDKEGTKQYWICNGCQRMFKEINGNESIDEPETIAAKGHEWGEWIVTKKATEEKEGEEKRICKNDSNHIEIRSTPKIIINITFEGYNIIKDGDYVIVNVGTTKEELMSKMQIEGLSSPIVTIENVTEQGILKSGSKIKINGKEKSVVIVRGDVNGDGQIKPIDITMANNIRLNKIKVSKVEKKASDMDLDEKIKPIDITIMNNRRRGK